MCGNKLCFVLIVCCAVAMSACWCGALSACRCVDSCCLDEVSMCDDCYLWVLMTMVLLVGECVDGLTLCWWVDVLMCRRVDGFKVLMHDWVDESMCRCVGSVDVLVSNIETSRCWCMTEVDAQLIIIMLVPNTETEKLGCTRPMETGVAQFMIPCRVAAFTRFGSVWKYNRRRTHRIAAETGKEILKSNVIPYCVPSQNWCHLRWQNPPQLLLRENQQASCDLQRPKL